MEFPGFLGNEGCITALSAAFAVGRFPHAIVLQGAAGCGKRTLAGLIAKALVCRDREHAPCGKCPSCVRAAAGSHPDIRVVEGSGATRSLSVDAVREISADAYRAPEEADVSVYILLMGARTSDAAQNKLLKIIEEPPAGVVFLLVCESAEQLLPTIRSRAQVFTLKPPSLEEAAAYVKEKAGLSMEEAQRLAAVCGGNIGRMLEEGADGESAKAQQLAEAVAVEMLSKSADGLLKLFAPLQRDRRLCGKVLGRLETIFRDALVLRTARRQDVSLLGGAPEAAERLCALPKASLCALPGIAEEYRRKLERNANVGLLLTCLCAALRGQAV